MWKLEGLNFTPIISKKILQKFFCSLFWDSFNINLDFLGINIKIVNNVCAEKKKNVKKKFFIKIYFFIEQIGGLEKGRFILSSYRSLRTWKRDFFC